MEPISFEQLDVKRQYSLAEYWSFRFDRMVELVKGFIISMSPSPAQPHQQVSWNLTILLGAILKGQSCKAFAAPFDVYLESIENPSTPVTVVQPDLLIVCDESKLLRKRGCEGAPDWIAEVVSPGSGRRDYDIKFHLYEAAGVREYWIIDPANQSVETFLLDEASKLYLTDQIVSVEGQAHVRIMGNAPIDLKELFAG